MAAWLRRSLRGEPGIEPLRQQLQGRVRVHRADPRPRLPAAGPARRARRRPGMNASFLRSHPGAKWTGIALIAVTLFALPFALAMAGTAWVRITNLAILFVLLSLGLNIVVGFAGLLDLGYIAFYAVGAYTYALLASPHFNLHLPWWVILPIGAAIACFF